MKNLHGSCKRYHIEAGRRERNRAELFAKEFSSKSLRLIFYHMERLRTVITMI